MMPLDYLTHPAMFASMFRSIKNSNMQKIDIFDFYELGKVLGNLKTVFHDEELNDGEKWQYVARCQYWIISFLEKTKRVDARKSIEIANKLRDELSSYSATLALNDASADVLKKEFAPKVIINKLIDEFEKAFDEESEHLGSFLVTQKGIYDTEKLISDASEHFEPEVLKHLPETTIYDFREAGKCLAFECPTACAYHALRGIEAVIVKFYKILFKHSTLVGKKRIKTPGWNNYVEELKKLSAPPSITERLDEIRKKRNAVAHPKLIVKLEDAKSWFDLCSGVVPLMAQEIEKIESANTPIT